jgi:hypothetical protein
VDAVLATAVPQLRDCAGGQVVARAEGRRRLPVSLRCAAKTVAAMDQESKQKQANIRLALLLAAIALGVLVGFIWVTAAGGGPG